MSAYLRSVPVVAVLTFAAGCSGKSGGISVSTPNAPTPTVSSVTVNPTSATVNVGATTSLSASVSASGGASTAVTWSTASASIASVSSTGLVTGVSAGTTTVTATSVADAGKSASATITVTASVATIALSATATSVQIGRTQQVTAVARDAAGNVITNPTLTWATSAPGIATVSSTGVVTGVSAGTANITAASGSATSSGLTIIVVPATTATSWSTTRAVQSGSLASIGSVFDLWSPGTTPVYAAMTDGVIGRFDGTNWTIVDAPGGSVFGIGGASANEIYAVGSGGLIRRWNGLAWSTMTSGTGNQLNHVWISGPGTGFAVGLGGVILRLANGAWSSMGLITTTNLWRVWGTSATNVFAIGEGGVILRYNGTSWSQMTSGTTQNLWGIWGNGPNFAVAVGSGGTIRVFNGTTWATANSGTTLPLWTVSGDPNTGTISVGVGNPGSLLVSTTATALTSWTSSVPPGSYPPDDINAVWRNDAIGTLAGLGSGLGGVLLRSPTGAWSISTISPGLNGVAVMSGTSAHAAGNWGTYTQMTGSTWQGTLGTGGTYNYFGQLYSPTASQVYATRFDGVWSLVGGTWSSVFTPPTTSWLSIGGTGANDMYIGGPRGSLYRYNGATWSPLTGIGLNSTELVRSWAGIPNATNGPTFAAGYDGVTGSGGFVFRMFSGIWTKTNLASNAAVGISVVDANTAFAVGAGGAIWRYDGNSWSPMNSGTTQTLNAVWAASATEVYAAGNAGTLLAYNGTIWQPVTTGTSANLNAIHGIRGVMVIAVGQGMTIVRGTPSGAALMTVAPNRRSSVPGTERVSGVDAAPAGSAGAGVSPLATLRRIRR